MCPPNDCDYYNRGVVTGEIDAVLVAEIDAARATLIGLLAQHDAQSGFDINTSIEALQNRIRVLKTPEANQKTKNVVALLNYLVQIKSLGTTKMIVPEQGDYIISGGALSGVTEKIGLINVGRELPKLNAIEKLNFETTDIQSINFNLKEHAMLKLPKHGKSRGVQREAMALEMSRILDFNDVKTTESTTVAYQGGPALFVRFDDIRELNQFATGKDMGREFSFSNRPNTHYATINPLGNPQGKGLRANPYINDFGSGLGLTYLCSDTDALGGNSQNKALLGNKLYVFDQAFKLDDRLELDSRLSMKPKSNFYSKAYLRHGRGRNRTLIEDSSIEQKFDSLMQLVDKKDELIAYCQSVAAGHQAEKARLIAKHRLTGNYFYSSETRAQIKRLRGLRYDALEIRKKVEQRIGKIEAILPKVTVQDYNPNNKRKLSKKALVLEKLLNKPVLFTPEGRPYRNPWTNAHAIKALSVDEGGHGFLKITFNNKIPEDVFNMLRRHFLNSDMEMNDRVIKMRKSEFLALKESQLFPEHNDELNLHEKNCLNLEDLNVIKSGYSKEPSIEKIIDLIEQYNRIMSDAASSKGYKLGAIQHTMKCLDQLIKKSSDQGFGQHVLKKFHVAVQQQLQLMMQESPLQVDMKKLNAAFQAAMRLDQVEKFNEVMTSFVSYGKDMANLDLFLTACIEYDHEATCYSEYDQAKIDIMSSGNETSLCHLTRSCPLEDLMQQEFDASKQLNMNHEFYVYASVNHRQPNCKQKLKEWIDKAARQQEWKTAKIYPVEALSKSLSKRADETILQLTLEKVNDAKADIQKLRARGEAATVEAGAKQDKDLGESQKLVG